MPKETVKVANAPEAVVAELERVFGNRLLKRELLALATVICESAEGHVTCVRGVDVAWETSSYNHESTIHLYH